MPRAAVLGSPIAHSLSPVVHRAAYKAAGLKDWRYTAVKCDEAALAARLAEMRADGDWAGLSLTMPLKIAAVGLMDEVVGDAAVVEAVNTVVFGRTGLVGHNTDVAGLLGALSEIGVTRVDAPVVILGGGGAARAALAAAAALRAPRIDLVVRVASRATPLTHVARALHLRVGVTPWSAVETTIHDAALVIATTPREVTDPLAKRPWP
ncbi:MAG: shikimate dehydrogenase, partial [Mycobacteriales bacterium]